MADQYHKQKFGGMNLDRDVRALQPGQYRLLTNGIPVQPKSSGYSLSGMITNLYGNALVSYSLPSGTNKVIGFLEDRVGNRAFYAVYNTTAANNSIYQYKNGTITLVFRSALLAFTDVFVDMDIIGDILFITDDTSDIKMINITSAIAGGIYTPAAEEITLIKRPPKVVLTWAVVYDTTKLNNYVADRYFQFYYRYVYKDDGVSVFSGASRTSNGYGLSSTVVKVAPQTNTTLSGTAALDGVGIITAGDRVLLAFQTAQLENGIWVVAAGAWTRATDADSSSEIRALTVSVSDGLEGSGTTWKNTNQSAITVGATAITFEPVDGPNAIDITTSTSDIPATVKEIEYAVRINGGNELIVYRIDKVPLGGATHTFYNDTFLSTVPDSESFKWNDSIPLKSKALKVINNRLFLFNNTEGYAHSTTTSIALTAYSASQLFSVNGRAVSHYKDGGVYNVGLVFFDGYGRFVGGVHCDSTIQIPYRKVPWTAPQLIKADLSGIAQADIPLAAVSYAIVISNETTRSFFIRYLTTDIFYYTEDADGIKSYTKTYGGTVKGTAIDLLTLTYVNIGYTWQSGDRIRINPCTLLAAGRDVIVDVEIISQEGRFLITRALNELSASFSGASSFVFEIYTPKSSTIEPFYEVGDKYPITLPGGGSRTLSDLDISPVGVGDVTSVYRSVYANSGGYVATTPLANAYTKTGELRVSFEAMNSLDKNFDKWVKQGGKSVVKSDRETTQISKTLALRFGQVYTPGTSILNINTFESLDEQNLAIENGAGVGLASSVDTLVAIHEAGSTAVYVGQGFVETSNGNSFLTKTESVIGDTRKYSGGHGSIHQASIVTRNDVVYWLNARKGVVIRRAQDGLTPISELYGIQGLISALCVTHLALGSDSRIIGGWDPQNECYCLSFIKISDNSGYTFMFHEKTNAWVCRTDMKPEFWGILGQYQLAFKTGALWAQTIEANYNNFFGVQYSRSLAWEIAPMESLEKVWAAIEVDIESIYSTAGTNEDIVLLYQYNGGTLQTRINYLDFTQRGSAWWSSFFRSLNDINFATTTESKYKSRHMVRGQSAYLTIAYNGTDRGGMKSISVYYRPSMKTFP